jgi:hypothetical protein
MTSYVGGEYSVEQGMKAFALGAVGGAFGAAFDALPAASSVTKIGAEIGFDVASSTIIDVASGADFSQGIMHNVLLSAVGGVGGKVQASVAKRFAGSSVLGADLTAPISRGLRHIADDILDDTPVRQAAAKSKSGKKFGPSHISKSQRELIHKAVLHKLMNSTDLGFIVGGLIEGGEVQLKLARFLKRPGARGQYVPEDKTLYINEKYFMDEYGGILNKPAGLTDLTSTVVHEGTHFLGGGEITAHLAQGQFLDIMLRKNPKLELYPTSYDLAHAARVDSIMPMLRVIGRKGYGWKPDGANFRNHLAYPIKKLPEHHIVTDFGGFESLLDMKQSSVSLIRAGIPTTHTF